MFKCPLFVPFTLVTTDYIQRLSVGSFCFAFSLSLTQFALGLVLGQSVPFPPSVRHVRREGPKKSNGRHNSNMLLFTISNNLQRQPKS